jgi:hypothetical protein
VEIIDYLIFAFLGWAAYDTIKDEGWFNGGISILLVVCFVLIIVIIPHYFGDLGKYILLGLLGVAVSFIAIKKYRKPKN